MSNTGGFGTGPFGTGPFGPKLPPQPPGTTYPLSAGSGSFLLTGNTVNLRYIVYEPITLGGTFRRGQFKDGRWVDTRARGQYTRNQWEEFKRKKRKEHDERKYAADRVLGLEFKDRSARLDEGQRLYEEFLQSLAAQQAQHAAQQAHLFTNDMLARLSAAHGLQSAAAHAARLAHMHQAARDDAEEEEALQLLMMEDD